MTIEKNVSFPTAERSNQGGNATRYSRRTYCLFIIYKKTFKTSNLTF